MNKLLLTDSYKIGSHWKMYSPDTERVYSYFEARKGGEYPNIVFFGLQYILQKFLSGKFVSQHDIDEAEEICEAHLGNKNTFNRAGWEYILKEYDGYLPIRIKAVKEGAVVPISNVLFTVENTDSKCGWLTNYLESLISHVWYPCTIATASFYLKNIINKHLKLSADNSDGLTFMLHGFGYRSYTSNEAAEIGALAHLVNFKGTDDILAIKSAKEFYDALLHSIAYSVPASEHSVMSSRGKEGEVDVVENLLNTFPTGVLSVVGDTYDIYNFVNNFVCGKFKDRILNRDGVFVVRPDSTSPEHPTKESITLWIVETLYNKLGGYVNSKGFKVINKHCKVLYGDGLSSKDIDLILTTLEEHGFSAENIATFGCGSGLVQKNINRDTCRFAFKSSWQQRSGIGYDIFKQPKDESKTSKRGRFKLVLKNTSIGETYDTVPEIDPRKDQLRLVFENGYLFNRENFSEIRKNAENGMFIK